MNIVLHIKEGDLQVFEEVFELYHQKLYFYVLGKTKSSFCAEEVAQMTFVKLWKYRTGLNEEIPIEAQIFRIARTTMIDQLRKNDYSEKLLTAIKGGDTPFETNSGLDNLEKKELYENIQKVLSKMPPARRRVFEMSRLQEMTHKEIATQLSISVNTVENHISQALKQIRKGLPFLIIMMLLYLAKENKF